MVSSSSAVVASLVGVTGVFYLLWQLVGRLRKNNIRNKVVLITGASSGLGEGNTHTMNSHDSRASSESKPTE